jgi:hypothetical protein
MPMTETIPRALLHRDNDRLRRYREYLDYYEGLRGSPPPRARERTLTFNYARTMVEKGASYLVSEHGPVVTPVDDTAAGRRRAALTERALLDIWQENDLTRLDFETEVDTAVLGDGAFKVTWDEREQRVVVTAPDVQGLFAWWVGDDVRRLSPVASRYRLPADETVARLSHAPRTIGGHTPSTVEVVEVWTADTFELWLQNVRVEARANPYGDIPFVLYPNLPRPKQFWGISDIEPLREPIAELNRALTQLSRILELSGNPIAVLENVEDARDIAVQPGAVWELPEQARAYLLDLLQGGGVRLRVDYVDLVYRTLHDLAETPRVAFGDAGGDRSGIALQTELDPLLRKVARKRLIRSAALRRRDRLALRVLDHHTGRTLLDGVRTDIVWGPMFTAQPGLVPAAPAGA